MKKNELSLGMRVENHYGREGTVIAIGGWKPKPSSWGYHTTPFTIDGREYKVRGYRDEKNTTGILVSWDDHGDSVSVESTRSLFLIGAYEAKQEEQAAETAARAEARMEAELALLRELVDTWGGEVARAICDNFGIIPGGPLSANQSERLRMAISIGETAKPFHRVNMARAWQEGVESVGASLMTPLNEFGQRVAPVNPYLGEATR